MQGQQKTVAFYTLGCKLNTYDTEWYREKFADDGYSEVPFGERADVTVVNTCTVTGQGDSQSRQMLRKAHRASPEGMVVAVGCYAQTDPDALVEMPEVDFVVGTAERTQLLDLINDTCSMGRSFVSPGRTADFQEMDIMDFGGRARAFVKVQEGCNEFCSFCIIPFARGRSRSRSLESTVDQVQRFVDRGYQEIVLTGVHIGDYGADLDEPGLLDILLAIEKVDGLQRFRISSIEASFVTPELIQFFSSSPKFCRHLHIPLQSGDGEILGKMRRPYGRAQYEELVHTLSDRIPGIGLGADVMVGFPGETDGAFENTRRLIEETPLVYLHVFPYSPRSGTPASKMSGQVPGDVKKHRSALLREIGEGKAAVFRASHVGEVLEVCFESRREPGTDFLQGVSDNYIRVYASGPDEMIDRIRPVRIDRIEEGRVIGEPTAAVAMGEGEGCLQSS